MGSAKSIARAPLSRVGVTSIVSSWLSVQTAGVGFVDLTGEVGKFIAEAEAQEGAVTLFVRHTSASLTIQENADPSVLVDLLSVLNRLAPQSAAWTHDSEGPDDMPAHVKTMLTATSLQIPVLGGRLALGTWQAIYLIEHRRRAHAREVVLQFIGAAG
ncbi:MULTISPECIES: secondary thiamine-phosphate synthase enzyme YjbQ [Rhodopseudomonas]|uniref:Secondary thiamine-phosphate synthase enzyme n=1 Tax=Rhodopseudomonas palustris TaxID=1076 RepID=A0A0D7EH65_RHOPL|nr:MULTISPECIES: secondary thiamine-phosphate synthase enzyme YjbQ [Rhodopseudomonas]KIZ39835.1 secondary thiamine-phosphate synthase enzyme [Rhodopseudomonas palustris]MDF3811475.1 secondary thiamine-phosphate synthase enzyme YjbQ [Rhodopseudomonas sp. BAL398]WOK17091.1 secondary thiamine-phosphate synthase enzyme YjbQ [Rhodopseudomonas sp. BAL398]